MKINIVVPGNPVSVNSIWRRGKVGMFLTYEATAWKETVAIYAKKYWRAPPLQGRVSVSLTCFFKSRRHRDIDNVFKCIGDAMEGICYENDEQIDRLEICRQRDAKNPRVEIVIEEIA